MHTTNNAFSARQGSIDLFEAASETVLQKFVNGSGRVAKLAKSKMSDEELIEEAFLATLSRLPRTKEKADALDHLKTAKTRTEGVTDLVWALVNTPEFLFVDLLMCCFHHFNP